MHAVRYDRHSENWRWCGLRVPSADGAMAVQGDNSYCETVPIVRQIQNLPP
jgi:hypothetical protein